MRLSIYEVIATKAYNQGEQQSIQLAADILFIYYGC